MTLLLPFLHTPPEIGVYFRSSASSEYGFLIRQIFLKFCLNRHGHITLDLCDFCIEVITETQFEDEYILKIIEDSTASLSGADSEYMILLNSDSTFTAISGHESCYGYSSMSGNIMPPNSLTFNSLCDNVQSVSSLEVTCRPR